MSRLIIYWRCYNEHCLPSKQPVPLLTCLHQDDCEEISPNHSSGLFLAGHYCCMQLLRKLIQTASYQPIRVETCFPQNNYFIMEKHTNCTFDEEIAINGSCYFHRINRSMHEWGLQLFVTRPLDNIFVSFHSIPLERFYEFDDLSRWQRRSIRRCPPNITVPHSSSTLPLICAVI